jgi:class II lanthipeptide synthase
MSSLFSDPAWHRALALHERQPAPDTPGDSAVARRRLARWRDQPPFAPPSPEATEMFARRLAADGLSEEDFLALLGEPDGALAARLPAPSFGAELARLFAEHGPGAPRADVPLPPFESVADPTGVAFLGLVLPLLRAGYDRLCQDLAALPPGPFAPAVIAPLLFRDLLERQLELLPRTLVLELQAARLEGSLAGESPAARFLSFAARLRDPEAALTILARYPVLARLAAAALEDWRTASRETLERLVADWPAIVAAFSPEGDPGPLAAIRPGAGDRHRNGRSVTLLRFASGLRLVYKPRSLAVEAAFQELLAWANERGFSPPLPRLRVLDRQTHGWVELIAAAPCSSPDEVRRFYERQGGYLALFYLLDGSDQHAENIVAAGEHPYAVDLETLFHPRVDGPRLEDAEAIPGSALFHSVLRIGFLPKWMASPGGARLDSSGLGSVEGQESRHPLLHLDGSGTDEMRFARRPAPLSGARNRPVLDGREADLSDYAAELAAGCERMLRLLLSRRDELLAPGGPLAEVSGFAGAPVRVVFRPTATYGELLGESLHPDVLGNALLRDRLLDRLWVAAVAKPWLAPLIAAERHDLARGDIPLFTTRPGSTDLETSLGTLPGFFGESGMARVRGNLRRLSEDDIRLQLWTLQGCLTALDLSRRLTLTQPYRLAATPEPVSAAELLAAARAVGDRLGEIAFRGPEDAWWLTLAALAGGRWAFATAQADLYEGVPGIVLFLAWLAARTGEERYRDLGRRGLKAIDELLRRGTPSQRSAGAWNGLGGLLYTFCHLAVLWRDESFFARAEALLPELALRIESDESYDLMSGAAGAVSALLVLAELRPGCAALELARRAGERLAERALPQPRGVAWPPAIPGVAPLVGFSHGTAGIGWALERLAGATGEARYRDFARSALLYERAVFDPVQKNWPDFREYDAPTAVAHNLDPFLSAWCNGAAGIGLARLGALDLHDGPEVREEIDAALDTTLARGFGKNHCLCHGDLGNVELLLEAGRRLGAPEWIDKAYRIAGGVLADIASSGWRLGMPRGAEPPGLMVGLAGIGYGLLRLADPDAVPSVLLLAGPGAPGNAPGDG